MSDGQYSYNSEPISYEELSSLVATEIQNADNDFNSEIIGNATDAVNYFLIQPKGDEEAGRSTVQDGTVADNIDAVMAEIQPMYTVDELIEVKAEGPDDEDQSKRETKALNWYWRERLRGYERLDEAAQDALLMRNFYLKIWPETSWKLPYERTLEGQEPQIEFELAQLIQSGAQVKEYSREILQEAVAITEQVYSDDGLALEPLVVGMTPATVRVEIQVIERQREVKAATIAREDVGVSTDAETQSLQKARFSFHRRKMSRNEAIGLGFYRDDVYALQSEQRTVDQVDNERQEGYKNSSNAAHRGGDQVFIYQCWYHVDADGDGIAELHQIFQGNNKRILRWSGFDGEAGPYADEIIRVVPVAAGVTLRMAHRHLGRSLFDKLRSTEDIKRNLKRQMNNNISQANDKEYIIGQGVSEDDFELGFSGGYKRAKDVNQVKEVTYTPIINESLTALQYYDTVATDRAGAALQNAGQEKPTNIQASTFERWMSGTERTTAMYMRNLGAGIRDAFVLLHMALKTLGDPIDYQDGDEWQREEPKNWVDRERFSVRLGKSEGERTRLIASYENQLEKSASAMQNGGDGLITDWSQVYEMLTDQANLMGIENHWLDPERVVGQQQLPNGQVVPVTAIQRSQQMQAQAAQQAQQVQAAQQDKLLSAQLQITQLQEETKRLRDSASAMNDAQELIQKSLDSIRDFVTAQTKIEADSGQDVPGGVLYGDEDIRVTQ